MSEILFLDLVREDLERVEKKLRDTAQIEFAPLAGALRDLLDSGGKRLRPALVLLAAKFYPCDMAKVFSLAAAVETLHTATLVHDDMIDRSLLRRGHPTLNASWSDSATVLAGDYLFARAANFAAETENTRVVSIFARTLMTICDGELRQIFGTGSRLPTREDYYRRIYSKTASLFAASTEAGGVLSGAPEHQVQALRQYGHNLGMAFQITDDVLDFIGDERELGKPVGSDLWQGTITLPVLYFLAEHPQDEVLSRVLGSKERGAEEIRRVVARVRDSQAIAASLAEAGAFVVRAQEALQTLPANVYRQAMHDLADFVVERRK